MQVSGGYLVVIGASSGGVPALLELCGRLPPDFAAPVAVVQHVGNLPSLLPELLHARGPNPAMHATHGQALRPGAIFVAPPDHHMLVDADRITLTRGPKENHARPAIDPLFRSAAFTCGPRVIGVILTGLMDDGTAGLQAVKACGCIAIVQDPLTAAEPDMPASALRHVPVDYCLPVEAIAGVLQELVLRAQPPPSPRAAPEDIAREVAINHGDISMDILGAIAKPSPITCPDCGGGLWEVQGEAPLRFRCHLGHAYTAGSLDHAQAEVAENALHSGARALRERELLLRRLANIARAAGDEAQAAAGHAHADRVRARIDEILVLAEGEPDTAQGPA